jgi:hypothetical protein
MSMVMGPTRMYIEGEGEVRGQRRIGNRGSLGNKCGGCSYTDGICTPCGGV